MKLKYLNSHRQYILLLPKQESCFTKAHLDLFGGQKITLIFFFLMHSVWSIALGTRGPPDLAEGSGTESLTGIPELTHPTQQNSETF